MRCSSRSGRSLPHRYRWRSTPQIPNRHLDRCKPWHSHRNGRWRVAPEEARDSTAPEAIAKVISHALSVSARVTFPTSTPRDAAPPDTVEAVTPATRRQRKWRESTHSGGPRQRRPYGRAGSAKPRPNPRRRVPPHPLASLRSRGPNRPSRPRCVVPFSRAISIAAAFRVAPTRRWAQLCDSGSASMTARRGASAAWRPRQFKTAWQPVSTSCFEFENPNAPSGAGTYRLLSSPGAATSQCQGTCLRADGGGFARLRVLQLVDRVRRNGLSRWAEIASSSATRCSRPAWRASLAS
jgi:hypothetical protein